MKKKITIFGAGVAGLTAAHEFAERGFAVEVIDPEINDCIRPQTLDRGIGGMARSQYVCEFQAFSQTSDMQRLYPTHEIPLDDTIVFERTERAVPVDEVRARTLIRKYGVTLQRLQELHVLTNMVSVVTPISQTDDSGGQASVPSADARRDYVRGVLASEFPTLDLSKLMRVDSPMTDQDEQCSWLYFQTGLPLLPGEHGFRFFPSFYRHLFDTMKRTPILSPSPSELSRATVYDNLVSTDGLGFARAGKARSFFVARKPVTSFETLRQYLDLVLSELDYTAQDVARFQLKLFKYMTSSPARREREYERMSWGEFVQQQKYSAVSRQHIEFGPQMSAALRGSESDARTQGNITVQLLVDQISNNARVDATLDGPSSGAWLDHWHDYLCNQGVEFTREALVGFERRDQEVVPRLSSGRDLRSDGYVIALSLPSLLRLAASFPVDGNTDFARAISFGPTKLDDDLAKDCPDGPLQHLSGIQYYFATDIRFWRGHTQYLDSEWGLTSIAQPQFWARFRDGTDAYRSILSVDIGIWNREHDGRTAWSCTADEIAHHAWEQIRDHHDDAFRERYGDDARFPDPIAYSLDYSMRIAATGPKENAAPFLVNKISEYRKRPGRVMVARREGPQDPSKCISQYEVYADQWVIAGTHMQTYTRLTSMEAANESARHAVNALLARWRVPCERCEIWDPEDFEIADLEWLKELDEQLLYRGLPHFTDILGWQSLPDELLPGDLLRRVAAAAGGAR